MFLSSKDLQKKLLNEISMLKNAESESYYFEETDGKGKEGVFVFSDNKGSYFYVISERGNVTKKKITDSIFEISFWFIDSIVSDIASKITKGGVDYRNRLFEKELELINLIGINYRKAKEIKIDEILKLYP